MSTSAIAKRYARALVGIAAEQQTVEQYGSELGRVREAFGVEKYLRLILESPTFPLNKKAAILNDLMELLELSEGMRAFLGLLLEKDRLQYLAQIERDYSRLADEMAGLVRAAVTASRELDVKQQQAIKAGLEQQTGKQVELSIAVDEELIGGLQVEIGGRLFDGSLKTQLKRIEDTLKKG
ncbi:ATP synthase F1 subunit delta [Geothermobacter hydrogeniphilus]|uniref:ATP synthase subunit delta n=1 Tax=Geothermobacter hydrogeniphilus TaxID=1969733 RepID=A0A1X0XZD0_9BACT|nr:ATP synthase F1 subunit delta [Geothermobacter hydrogeniphilus]ORJ58263.1 ATP synthase F1 subunit delta [Geothermobacter hydrogeniphilus]